MKKLSKNTTAKPRKSRRKPELYFVIGGGINRTKCASMADAEAHATKLLRGQLADGKITLGVDLGRPGGDESAVVVMQHGNGFRDKSVSAIFNESYSSMFPKIEQLQCLNGAKPLYIVKVVGIAELVPPPVRVRQPKGDELA